MNRNEFMSVGLHLVMSGYARPINVPKNNPKTINAANMNILSNLLVLLIIGNCMML